MSHADNEQLITRFYEAFKARDHAVMAAAYTDDATFSDAVFTGLDAWRIGAMWRMLCELGTDLEVTFSDVSASQTEGSAAWQATYTFSATGRRVHNIIQARFTFRDGKIASHVDSFSLWRWMRMALGPIGGTMLGWLPPVQYAVRSKAAKGLARYIEKQGIGP